MRTPVTEKRQEINKIHLFQRRIHLMLHNTVAVKDPTPVYCPPATELQPKLHPCTFQDDISRQFPIWPPAPQHYSDNVVLRPGPEQLHTLAIHQQTVRMPGLPSCRLNEPSKSWQRNFRSPREGTNRPSNSLLSMQSLQW